MRLCLRLVFRKPLRFPEWVAQQTEARLPNANHGGYGLLLILTAEALEIGRLGACFTGCQFTVVGSDSAAEASC